jgi:predicted nucleotidyltransferase
VPGFVLLKTVAFQDRLATGNQKFRSDAEDLLFWLRNYASGAQEGRRYDILAEGAGNIEFLDAGAAVLGFDVAELASPAADGRVRTFLAMTGDLYSPFLNAAVSPGNDDDRPRILKVCTAFGKGYEARRVGR